MEPKTKENGIETVEREKGKKQNVLEENEIIKVTEKIDIKSNEKENINESVEEEADVSLQRKSERNRKNPDRLNI